MTSSVTKEQALGPVRAVLLAQAQEEAAQTLSRAEAEAAVTCTQAHQEASRLVAQARVLGESDAKDALAGQQARVRAQARALVLEARQAAYAQLGQSALESARSLVAGSPALRERVIALGREILGPEGEVMVGDDGAVVVHRGDRRWEWSPDLLADQALEELGQQVEQLWAP